MRNAAAHQGPLTCKSRAPPEYDYFAATASTQAKKDMTGGHILFCGAGNQTRTDDLLITNQLLYRLSYSSIHFHLSRSHRRQGGLDSASTIPHLPPAVKSVSQPRAFFVGRQGEKKQLTCAPQKTSQPQRSGLQSSPAQMPPVYRIYLST